MPLKGQDQYELKLNMTVLLMNWPDDVNLSCENMNTNKGIE
jgi:hypothetical protein